MKGYTTIEQSRKLLELGLSPKTADLSWVTDLEGDHIIARPYKEIHDELEQLRTNLGELESKESPAWSLSALIELMPATIQTRESKEPYSLMLFKRPPIADEGYFYEIEYGYRNPLTVGWLNEWYEIKGGNDLIEVCFDMVVWLIEKGYIKTK